MPLDRKPSADYHADIDSPDFSVALYEPYEMVAKSFPTHQRYPNYGRPDFTTLDQHNPITKPRPGLLTRDTRIGTIGSCFAREFKRWLIANDYTYVQTERGPGAHAGSVRTGAVYNTASIRQLFEHAEGLFKPTEKSWAMHGRLLDPYRRGIAWPDERSMVNERAAHAAATREMVERCDVLIWTCGLAEVWRNAADKSAFFMTPPPELRDPTKHEFVLLSVEENLANLQRAWDLARARNPNLTLMISLSPVPLFATFRDIDGSVADTVSKAILRVAIDEFCRRNPEVIYIPSYEIVTRLTEGGAYEKDNRHVKPEVVSRIMRTVMQSYGEPELAATPTSDAERAA